MPMKDDRLRVAHLCRVLVQWSFLGPSCVCAWSVRFTARGFLSLVPSARVPPSPGSGTSLASTARDSRTPARLPSRYRTSCGIGYRWGRVSELWSGIVPYGCSWVRVFGRERPCVGSRGHETHRVGEAGSSVIPDFSVARWIGYRLENDPYTPIGEPLWGLLFPVVLRVYAAGKWGVGLCATGGFCSRLPRRIVRTRPLSYDIGLGVER